jgi:hypothetical protein
LIHRNAVASVGHGEVGMDISFHVLTGGSVIDVQQVEHKFSDGVGGGQVRCRNVRWVEGSHYIVAVTMFGAELLRYLAECEPMAEEMMDHVHAATLAMLKDDDGHAGWGHPGHEAFEVCEPLVGGDVIEGVGAEDEIALFGGPGGQDRLAYGVDGWNDLLELVQQIGVRFDRDGAVEGASEGAGDFAVAGPCINKYVSRGQIVHHLLQPALSVPLLVGVIQENLKRLLVGLTLGIKDTNAFRSRHPGAPVIDKNLSDGAIRSSYFAPEPGLSRHQSRLRLTLGADKILFAFLRHKHHEDFYGRLAEVFAVVPGIHRFQES